MSKRFTDTDKFKKQFIKLLPAAYKLLWIYICDDCDHAGIWHVDMDVAKIRIGIDVSEQKATELFKDKIVIVDSGEKWFIPSFIEFQYGKLNEKNKAHWSVLKILKKYNLEIKGVASPLYSPLQGATEGATEGAIQAPMDKDKDMDMDKDMDKDGGSGGLPAVIDCHPGLTQLPVTEPTMQRIGALFGRGASATWNAYEWSAFKKLVVLEEDLTNLAQYYASNDPEIQRYKKQKLATLLDDWNGQCDRAREWVKVDGIKQEKYRRLCEKNGIKCD